MQRAHGGQRLERSGYRIVVAMASLSCAVDDRSPGLTTAGADGVATQSGGGMTSPPGAANGSSPREGNGAALVTPSASDAGVAPTSSDAKAFDAGERPVPVAPEPQLDPELQPPVLDSNLPPPVMDVQPTAFDFGRVVGGQTAPGAFILHNTGGSALRNLFIYKKPEQSDFRVNPTTTCGDTLEAGESCIIFVEFSPAPFFPLPGGNSLELHAARADPKYLPLNGVSVQPGELTSYASGHDFGLVDIDTMSTQFTWVVTNSTEVASGALELTNTNLDEFITQSDCAELPPYGSCSIFVRFQPTGFGVRSGKLMLVSPLSPTAQVWLSVMGRGR